MITEHTFFRLLRGDIVGYDYKKIWCRQIDKIEFYEGRMRVTCTNGNVYTGKSNGACLGTDANGEDVDGVSFTTDEGNGYTLIESDIKSIEYLDGKPEE